MAVAVRFGLRLRLLGGLVAASLVTPTGAQDLTGAVSIGDEKISANIISAALDECARDAPELARDTCLDRYFAPRWLLDAQARADQLRAEQGSAFKLADILHARLIETIAEEVPAPSEKAIDAYIDKHSRDFEKPLRIRIFRILLAQRTEAEDLLKKLSATTTVADFRKLAREHSLDRATNERAGDLGFVWPDGSTDVPQVSAETSLYEAAKGLADGEFCSEPVEEGKRFAVIWRRGTLAPVERDETSRKLAAARLVEQGTEDAVQALLKKLSSKVSGRDNMLLGKLRRKEATLFAEP